MKGFLNQKELERHRKYKKLNSNRYNYSWNKTHKEARNILELSDKDSETCYDCGEQRKVRCHHVDGNPYNNALDNLAWCCYSCDSKQNDRKYKLL